MVHRPEARGDAALIRQGRRKLMSVDSGQVLDPGSLVIAFAPVFAAAVGVQKLIEILDAVLDWVTAHLWAPDGRRAGKRLLAGLLSLVLGFASAASLNFGVLASLKNGKASPCRD